VGMDAVSSTVFSCERCDEAITEQEGDFDDIRSKVGGRVQGKAISGEWKYLVRRSKAGRLVPIEKKRENINERCARIRRWRDAIDNVEGWHLDSSFQDTAVYSEMKPHLSKQVREKIEVPRNTLTLKPRPGIAINGESNKQLLLDEIVRIEREWGLI
jgi:hypothetical protein